MESQAGFLSRFICVWKHVGTVGKQTPKHAQARGKAFQTRIFFSDFWEGIRNKNLNMYEHFGGVEGADFRSIGPLRNEVL